MIETHKSFCRLCAAACPILVDIEDGIPLRVSGDRSAPLYGGYTCVKGRALPNIHRNHGRLLHSLKKDAEGRHHPISTAQAIDEIADKLTDLIEKHGPRSIAFYYGNAIVLTPSTAYLAAAFMSAIGSPMSFSAGTLDQPGVKVANALHGEWQGGMLAAKDADAALIVGGNPVISKQYFAQNPARRLKDQVNSGMKLVVIDPRKTETSRRAHIHLQVRPGEDATVLAGLLQLILSADAIDHQFIAANVDGVSALRKALQPFSPALVAERAGVSESDLREAATILAAAEKAYIAGGTGVSMSGRSNLCFYLLLCLQSVRGFWPRAGANYAGSPVLTTSLIPRAQPRAPYSPILEGELRIRGLRNTVAGWPTNALPEEILTPGEGQIRALICSGNPLSAWPDADLARRAMANLELLVVPNVELSETTRMAHYVIAAKQILETPATTQHVETIRRKWHPGYAWDEPYAQYTPALVAPPVDADVIEEWQFLFRLAQRMNRPVKPPDVRGRTIQPTGEPTSDELIDIMCGGSPVAIEDIRKQGGPELYPEAQLTIGERDPACRARLNVGEPGMMEELAELAKTPIEDACQFPYRLISRRSDGTINSMHRRLPGVHRKSHNPAFMNPIDMERLGLDPGTLIVIQSRHNSVTAIVEGDASLKPGVLAISHGYGAAVDEEDDPQRFGTNVNRLLKMDQDYDRITGMPLMSAVPVAISRAGRSQEPARPAPV